MIKGGRVMASEKQCLNKTVVEPDALTYEDRSFLAAIRVPELREKIVALLKRGADCHGPDGASQ